jgi:hypothetical protein
MKQIPTQPAELEVFRSHADPLADKVIQTIMSHKDARSISQLFDQLIRNNDYSKVDLPKEVRAYFETTGELPTWADQSKIKIGQQVFADYGPSICLLLLCKSLPEAYSCKKGAQVMFQTGRMEQGKDGSLDRFTRRLMETSQFVMNVCTPGGFGENGNGIITAQKVRLIHATIRYYIQKGGHWDSENLGLPINQEDLAGTLQSFSALIIEGLKGLGIELSETEREGYFHVWRVAGHIVGLDPQLNPENYDNGLKLGYAILDHQQGESEAGVTLTQAVLHFMQDVMPGNLFKHSPAILMRYLLGNQTADLLEIPPEDSLWAKVLPRITSKIFHAEEKWEKRLPFFRELADHLSMSMLNGLLQYFNEYKTIRFYIPPSLQENWKLTEKWVHFRAISPPIAGYRMAIEKKSSTLK